MAGETVERARGRWRELLPRLGVSAKHVHNKHGPCPICGGRDRFRFDDKDGSGSYYCNQCGPGIGIVLVQKVNGWDFKTAAAEIDKIIGERPAPPQPAGPSADDKREQDRRRAALQRVLDEATDRSVAEDYARQRGLGVVPAAWHGHPALPYYDADGGKLLGRAPAVVMPVLGPDGDLRSVHRIYVGRRERRKKLMPGVVSLSGAAIRLFDHGETLGIAEGPETAVAAYQMDGVPTWAVISTTLMEKFIPPPGVRRVVIYGDNDENFAGQKAAFTTANRLIREGYEVEVKIPPHPGMDWLDVLIRMEVAA